MTTIYAIADVRKECMGHGDYLDVEVIQRQGSYGMDGFPPTFTTKEAAQAYLDALPLRAGKAVVTLELRS